MKYKVKDLLERKEAVETIARRMNNLGPTPDDSAFVIDMDDADSVRVIIEEYGELLDELIEAAEVVF